MPLAWFDEYYGEEKMNGPLQQYAVTHLFLMFVGPSQMVEESALLDLKHLLMEAQQRVPPVLMALEDPAAEMDEVRCSCCSMMPRSWRDFLGLFLLTFFETLSAHVGRLRSPPPSLLGVISVRYTDRLELFPCICWLDISWPN